MEPSSSNISKLKQYSEAIELNDFIDFLISIDVLGKKDYYGVWVQPERNRLNEIFNIVVTNGKKHFDLVLEYLVKRYPNIEEIKEDERRFRISSVRGSFPKLPPNYVRRETLEWIQLSKHVKSVLENITWNKKLVVYGMMGYGKSCLVNEVLNDKILRKYFDNNVFWVNLGEYHNSNNVLQTMWKLYCSACNSSNKIHCPDDVQILKEHLINIFLEERLNNALIILDDVCSSEVLKLFDIGCRTVVTTQDKNILGREDAHFVEVKTGFSLNEAMNLFRISLGTDKDLPVGAEEVYYICKGHPTLIALIGSYLSDNRDHACGSKDLIWGYIETMFRKGEYRLNEFDEQVQIPNEMIKKCVNQLLSKNAKLKSRYEDLAIFLQDVNIPPEVLEILWDTDPSDVRNTMNKFAEKSLVVPFYHYDLQRFIYGVHDIYLNYLKEEAKDKLTDIHRRLILGYDKLTNGNYAFLPNDNYSLHFIGYHLYHAKHYDRFNIYFDLKFIEAKLKTVGKEDLLRDMEKYEKFITKENEVLKHNLLEYKEFIKKLGANLFNFPKTDIIQYALQEDKNNYVFKVALDAAKESSELYFEFQRPVGDFGYSQIIQVKDDVTCACFVDTPQHILVGTANGKIKLFFEQYEKEISSFVGHTGLVKSLVVSPDQSHFLSIGEDGLVFLWKFSADKKRNSMDPALPVSPKTTQKDWQDMFTPERGQIKPKRRFELEKFGSDVLVSANFSINFPKCNRIVTGSQKGNCLVWDVDSPKVLASTGGRGYETSCVYLCDNYLMFSYEDLLITYEIIEVNTEIKLTFKSSLYNREKINFFFIKNEEIVVVSESIINLWRHDCKQYSYKVDPEWGKNVCAALTDDGAHLVISTNQHAIYFWDVEKRKTVRMFEKGSVKFLDTIYDENSSFHMLLIGSDRKTLQQCHIQPCEKEPNTHNCSKFVPYWKKKQPFIPLVCANENKIEILHGYTVVSEIGNIPSEVTYACFSTCGNYVVYGLSNGDIRVFNIKTKTDRPLKNLPRRGKIKYLECFPYTMLDNPAEYNFNSDVVGMNSILAVCQDDFITVHADHNLYSLKVREPMVLVKPPNIIIVNKNCRVHLWNVQTNRLVEFSSDIDNYGIETTLVSAAFCPAKGLLAVCFKEVRGNFLNVVRMDEVSLKIAVLRHITLESVATYSKFSNDGCLLAVSLQSGVINIWSLQNDYKLTMLDLHSDLVEQLLFSPSIEPILVSLSDEVAWWNLTTLKEAPKIDKGKPKSIELLDNPLQSLGNLSISFSYDRPFVGGCVNLLACVRFRSKAKFISASNDFNSFLVLDEKGKIYIIEVVKPNYLS
ncbi:uncharacterized protein LOC132700438 isoform X2 [Cylas formicarius]|uniref:uncharacterized protein LOC132700438 isoform X2 n=1 Tax=Cylas formicarius TaxID=197179 RepID=UPI002958B975|nr:uncharacterized protein LOC132700438 isoform X2 [Cylas formicarius]